MLLKIYRQNPEGKKLDIALDILKSGGTIIYPTDSVYSLGCNLLDHKAVVKVASIKGCEVRKSSIYHYI